MFDKIKSQLEYGGATATLVQTFVENELFAFIWVQLNFGEDLGLRNMIIGVQRNYEEVYTIQELAAYWVSSCSIYELEKFGFIARLGLDTDEQLQIKQSA